jgi:hypothetical protein
MRWQSIESRDDATMVGNKKGEDRKKDTIEHDWQE